MKLLIIIFLFLPQFVKSYEILECTTKKHIGLNFLGSDYGEILNHLKLKNFKIKLSRSRKDISLQEKNEQSKNNNYSPKTSHFFEIVIIKSSGYPIPMHCSWVYDVRYNKINEKDFNCMGFPDKDRVFSLDFNGNFMYSSRFDEFLQNKKKNKTLHSLIGVCK
tara:strand:+ start:524 stop:1012 length:489 start_codon:yes stop_codon:yes gene_type:complete